ncbi:MAG: hypothetical protein AAGI38_05190, partial [Bacteroidota bacterium]
MLKVFNNSFPGAGEILPVIQKMESQHGITCTLLGAGARNVWLADYYQGNPGATKDADFAVFASSMEAYTQMKNVLVSEYQFDDSPRLPLTMLSPSGVWVDFLPFGPIEVSHEIPLSGFERAAQVHGLAEACSHAIPLEYEGMKAGNVVSLPGLVLLKLISLDDRPNHRLKDA